MRYTLTSDEHAELAAAVARLDVAVQEETQKPLLRVDQLLLGGLRYELHVVIERLFPPLVQVDGEYDPMPIAQAMLALAIVAPDDEVAQLNKKHEDEIDQLKLDHEDETGRATNPDW